MRFSEMRRSTRAYFDLPALEHYRQQPNQAEHAALLWRALNLEWWLRRFVDRRPLST